MKTYINNLLLKHCTTHEVHTKLLEFPTRYHHFQLSNQKNIWKFQIISDNIDSLVVQLIDQTFEPPRGQVVSDQPHIYIRMSQKCDDVRISFSLKWQKLKTICIILGLIFYYVIITALFYVSTPGSRPFFVGILFFLLGFITTTTWFVRNIKHDRLIKRAFKELLQKNFFVDCVDS